MGRIGLRDFHSRAGSCHVLGEQWAHRRCSLMRACWKCGPQPAVCETGVNRRGKAMTWRVLWPLRVLWFFYQQRSGRLVLPETPQFDADDAVAFLRELEHATYYLEYGAGGSTVAAAKQCVETLCIESDKYYRRLIETRIELLNHKVVLHYSDIGITGPWGYPVGFLATRRSRLRYSEYVFAPDRYFQEDFLSRSVPAVARARRVPCSARLSATKRIEAKAEKRIRSWLAAKHDAEVRSEKRSSCFLDRVLHVAPRAVDALVDGRAERVSGSEVDFRVACAPASWLP